jgi:hypothetical protein
MDYQENEMSKTRKYKNIWSVPSWFKRMNRSDERVKANQSVREGNEPPVVKRRDEYEYW